MEAGRRFNIQLNVPETSKRIISEIGVITQLGQLGPFPGRGGRDISYGWIQWVREANGEACSSSKMDIACSLRWYYTRSFLAVY